MPTIPLVNNLTLDNIIMSNFMLFDKVGDGPSGKDKKILYAPKKSFINKYKYSFMTFEQLVKIKTIPYFISLIELPINSKIKHDILNNRTNKIISSELMTIQQFIDELSLECINYISQKSPDLFKNEILNKLNRL